jgi:prevent-host-death family protein
MGKHGVVEAKNRLSKLIDRALKGEDVVITRHGQPVVTLIPISQPTKPVTPAALDWLADRRAKLRPVRVASGKLISRLRNEWRR